ncbi:type IV pilus major pilin [Salmonella enterica]|uniref:type IV pilus major pilin n=1 Tax=Salmonella enterica TaxID=28901 RepID=UPI0004F164FF|nr:type IV pilus major pilin [Salmonella enterica]EDT7230053.1 type IV pilus major pilin [Salmonella enterica subsp. enterica]EAY8076959.1 type IV pilus major pilin [Salmonella enterica]EBO3471975.1 type IV pilus major pilin [Salmonella enterica]ECG7225605.1 type IV pilus major pilin [Salmonella enterica subsp. enterica serovar Bovismorbificans]ECL8753845.1 type IV pilus major pilin [Salmonella enterica]
MKAISLRDIRKRFMAQPEKYLNLKKQRGMTLLEIIIVLGIIGTIAAGVVILAQRAYDSKAISDLVNNTNVVRTAMKEAYGPTGIYPALENANTLTLTDDNISKPATALSPISKLYLLGKVSTSEAKNNISGNFFSVGGANLGTDASAANRGYVVEVNGLTQKQCRNILTQVGNQWDYVRVVNPMPAGQYTDGPIDMTANADGFTPATGEMAEAGVYRSLSTTDGNNTITPDGVIGACSDNASNGIILGSR